MRFEKKFVEKLPTGFGILFKFLVNNRLRTSGV